jgi:C1A family cysteine protease
MKKRFLSLLLAVLLTAGFAPYTAPPVSADEENRFVGGVIPETYTLTYPVAVESGEFLLQSIPRPASFTSPAVSGIRDQAQNGICWTFGATSIIEANIRKRNTALTPDISELHMAHSTSNEGGNTKGFSRTPGGGGHRGYAAAYLMRGDIVSGTVPESADPYAGYVTSGDTITSRLVNENNKPKDFTVQNIKFLSDDNKNSISRDALKDAITTYGAVAASMHWDGNSAVGGQSGDTTSYNAAKGAYFYNGSAQQNHAITLVGWDDAYKRENFLSARMPAGDGAWLVQNSWGTGWGNDGFFWISYEDTQAPITAWVIDGVEPYNSERLLHEVDYHGFEGSSNYGLPTSYGANIFSGAKNTNLEQVIFFVPDANTTVKIYAVPDYTTEGSLNITSMTPVHTELITHAGWYTRTLAAEVPITGDRFAVIIGYTAQSGNARIPMSRTMPKNQGFTSPRGTAQWDAVGSGGNLNIKAVTKTPATIGDAEAVALAGSRLTWDAIRRSNTAQNNVRTDLNLITSGAAGTAISWASTDTAVIAANGTVTRPDGEDAVVTLTATVRRGASSGTVVFELTVRDRNIPDTADIIIPSLNSNATINLTAETINTGSFAVAAFSVDGGKRWRKGALPTEPRRVSALFNKPLELWVSNQVDEKGRGITKGVVESLVLKFPAIAGRPKAERVMPWYNADNWQLSKRGSAYAAPDKVFEWAPTNDGRTPGGEWEDMTGLRLAIPVARETVLIRMKADEDDGKFTPASKIARLRINPLSKVPTLRVRPAKPPGSAEKVDAIAFRKGDQYSFAGGAFTEALTERRIVPVSELGGTGAEVRVRRAATGRRPPSGIQTITLP